MILTVLVKKTLAKASASRSRKAEGAALVGKQQLPHQGIADGRRRLGDWSGDAETA